MDWGSVVFGVVAAALGLGFLLLVVLALRRMGKGRTVEEEGTGGDEEVAHESGVGGGGEEETDSVESDAGEAVGDPEGGKGGARTGEGGDGGDLDEPDHISKKSRSSKSYKSFKSSKPSESVAGSPPGESGDAPDHPHADPSPSSTLRAPEKRHARDVDEEKRRLSLGLAKTRGGFIARLGSLFKSKPDLDSALLEKIEEVLFTADIGVKTSQELIDGLRQGLGKKEIGDHGAVWAHLRRHSSELLERSDATPLDVTRAKPFVILVVGVNGTGKTTTIGKLSALYKAEGYGVVLAAGDTFRAAAVEQLEIWGQRTGCPVIKGKEGADPTSVIIDALKQAKESGADLLIADTAGRLHTKVSLMEEIQKVRRSIEKRLPGAPHETFLVLDATMGQNAIAQAKMFKEALDISGLILTKLDGTAKGGVVLGICNELKIPVRFVGIGESAQDLREFDTRAFVEALFEAAE